MTSARTVAFQQENAYSFGWGHNGQLGNNSRINCPTPVQLPQFPEPPPAFRLPPPPYLLPEFQRELLLSSSKHVSSETVERANANILFGAAIGGAMGASAGLGALLLIAVVTRPAWRRGRLGITPSA